MNSMSLEFETIDFKKYLDLFRRKTWLILLVMLISSGIVLIAEKFQTPTYTANTQVSISFSDKTYTLNSQKESQSFVNLFPKDLVASEVSDQIGSTVTPDQISILLNQDALIISIQASDSDPKRASLIVDKVVSILIKKTKTLNDIRNRNIYSQFGYQINEAEKNIAKLQDQIVVEKKRALNNKLKNTENKISAAKSELSALNSERETLLSNASPEAVTRLSEVNVRIDVLQLLIPSYETLYGKLITTTEFQGEDPIVNALLHKLEVYHQEYIVLYGKFREALIAKSNRTVSIVQISPTPTPVKPVQSKSISNIVIGALAGLTLSLSFIFFADVTNKTIKSQDEVEKIFESPVLGKILNIPDHVDSSIYVINQPRSLAAETFRLLRTNLEFSSSEKPLKTILITSSGIGEGKTFIACNLAASLAQADKNVLLVDADFHMPSVHKYTSLENRIGLSDLLLDGQTAASVIQSFEQLLNLKVLTSGGLPPNPAELLGSKKMQQILKDLSADYDFIVIDAPSLLISDTQTLAPSMDGVLVIAVIGKTENESARNAKQQIQRAHARLLGIVINRVTYTGKTNPYSHYYPQDETVESDQSTWNKLIDYMKSLPQKIRMSRQKSEK